MIPKEIGMLIDKEQKRVFVDVHYEQVYSSMSLNTSQHALLDDNEGNDIDGIYQRVLLRSAVNQMQKALNSSDLDDYSVFLDMEHITKIDTNAQTDFRSFLKSLSKHRKVYIYNVNSDLVTKVSELIGKNHYHKVAENHYYEISDINKSPDAFFSGIHNLAREVFDNELTQIIKDCCVECADNRSPSSSVRLDRYINAKILLSDFKKAYYLVYRLALILEKSGVLSISEKKENKNKVLFVHTMNSTVIGSILAQLFDIDMLLVDHLGPYNKLFIDGIEESIDSSKKYIIVTDVVCMGTELNSARTLLDIFSVEYCACATLVDIIPVGKEEPAEQKINALYIVNKENNKIDYKIFTDLI